MQVLCTTHFFFYNPGVLTLESNSYLALVQFQYVPHLAGRHFCNFRGYCCRHADNARFICTSDCDSMVTAVMTYHPPLKNGHFRKNVKRNVVFFKFPRF